MIIKEAVEKDISVIQQIAYKTWPDTFKEILSPEQIEYMINMMYSTDSLKKQMKEGHQYLILLEGENNIGFISYQLHYSSKITKIHKIYVLPEIQGKGAGKKLIEKVKEIATENKDAFLSLNVNRNNKALQFYEHIAFKKEKEENIDIGNGFFMEDYVMLLEI